MRIGSRSLHGSLDNKQPIANFNFKMVEIFQDSHYFCRVVKICNYSVGDTLIKIGMSSVHASHEQKLLTAT